MARVRGYKGRSFAVKNLGWLLRHWKEVQSFDLAEVDRTPHGSGFMVAHLRGGGVFISEFASFAVMADWVRRPVFRGLPRFCCFLELTAEPEDMEVRGNVLCSGDDAQDKAEEDAILHRLDAGEVWAWAYVEVRATYGEYEGRDGLGGCSYANEREFRTLDGYYPDMVLTAIDQCRGAYVAALGDLEPIK
jgi:hypothetical protein